jgi:hypothetical protein
VLSILPRNIPHLLGLDEIRGNSVQEGMVIIFQFKHEMHSIVWVAALYYAPCFVLGFLIRCFQDLHIIVINKLLSRILCEIHPYLLYDTCELEGIFLLCICCNQNSNLWD